MIFLIRDRAIALHTVKKANLSTESHHFFYRSPYYTLSVFFCYFKWKWITSTSTIYSVLFFCIFICVLFTLGQCIDSVLLTRQSAECMIRTENNIAIPLDYSLTDEYHRNDTWCENMLNSWNDFRRAERSSNGKNMKERSDFDSKKS